MSELRILSPLLEHPDYNLREPFFFARAIRGLRSPLDLLEMERGVAMLHDVQAKRGHVLVVGDKDVDGVSSTALLANFLRDHLVKQGGRLTLRVSDSGDDYGLSGELLESVKASDADLVILLDMGSSHGPEIHEVIASGKKVVVLDHHQIGRRAPDHVDCAFINPQRNAHVHENEGKIPTVGLAFKFLFGYALSFLAEWKTEFAVPLAQVAPGWKPPSDQAPGSAPQGTALYRAGSWLGNAAASGDAKPLEETALKFLKDHLADARLREEIARSGPGALERILGSLLLSRTVEARPRLRDFLLNLSDLVSVGMITDMVPLRGENRTLVRIGLGLAGERKSRGMPGYRMLIQELDLPEFGLTGRDLAWTVGPTLNAAGRMGNTALALDLLTADSEESAKTHAASLKQLNRKRRERTKENERIVEELLASNPHKIERPIIFCYHPELKPGVSGIIATRLLERYGKPAVYVNPDGKWARGSARSAGINVLDLLDRAAHLFIQFGGHPEAAGFSIEYDKIELLEETLTTLDFLPQAESAGQMSAHLDLHPSRLGRSLFEELCALEPFGQGNPEPVFRLPSCEMYAQHFTKEHARFRVRGASGIEFVAWRMAEAIRSLGSGPVVLFGILERHLWAGRDRLQFRVIGAEAAQAASRSA
jgi:single-stranded-DNA-specific exonuclease